MNDLTATPNSKPARPTSPPLSEELTALLDDTGNPDRAARLIADTVPLRAEALRVLPALEAVALGKAGEDGVKAVIGRRLVTYPQPHRTDGEWDAWWSDYLDVLSDVSLASLEAAMRAYVALPESEFMPKPGKLREMAFLTPCRALQRLQRAKRALALVFDPKPPEKLRADPAEVKTMLADFEAKTVGGATKPQLLSIAGKVDGPGDHWEPKLHTPPPRWDAPPLPLGPLPRGVPDLSGTVFGRMTVIRYHGRHKQGAAWLCRCTCGAYELRRGKVIREPPKPDYSCASCEYTKHLAWTALKPNGSAKRAEDVAMLNRLAERVKA